MGGRLREEQSRCGHGPAPRASVVHRRRRRKRSVPCGGALVESALQHRRRTGRYSPRVALTGLVLCASLPTSADQPPQVFFANSNCSE